MDTIIQESAGVGTAMLGDAKLELDALERKVPHPFVLLELVELSLRNGGGVAVELGHRVHLKLRWGTPTGASKSH
jgi:hypothetical protein